MGKSLESWFFDSLCRGNTYKLQKHASHHNLRKKMFTGLPDSVVDADTISLIFIRVV